MVVRVGSVSQETESDMPLQVACHQDFSEANYEIVSGLDPPVLPIAGNYP